MNTYNNLINNLEALELFRFKENIDTYLDMIAGGEKTALDALCELTESEIDLRKQQAITGCVKVANFPFLKEICEFDFSFQPSLDKSKIMDLFDTAFYRKSREYHILRDSGSRQNKSCSINRDRSCKTQILRIFYNISGFNITAKKSSFRKQA